MSAHAVATETGAAPPLVPGLPLVGSMFDLRRRLLVTQEQAMCRLGDVVRFSAGPPGARMVVYSVFSPDGVQRVLTARAGYRKDNRFYEQVRSAVGNGLLTSQDDDWLRQKRFLQPLFVRAQMQRYGQAITDESTALVERWRAAASRGEPVLLHAEAVEFTIRVVGRILFGADISGMIPLVRTALPVITEDVYRRGFSPLSLPRRWPTPRNRRVRRAIEETHAAILALIDERRRHRDGRRDMLALLTEPGSDVTVEEARDQLLVFLFAGHDTTASALTFTLHLLGNHPHVQRLVADEVRQVLAGRAPTAEDVERLPYLGQVLKEALRLYPPAYATSRRLVHADVVDGYRIPAGSDVAVYPWCTHRHPRLWDHPGRFDPDRFTPEREAARHRYAWFPFGGGPRACIGAQISIMEATIALASIVQAYELRTPAGPVAVAPRITLHPTDPTLCRVTPRRQ